MPREADLGADHLQKTRRCARGDSRQAVPGVRSDHSQSLLKTNPAIIYNRDTPAAHSPYYMADAPGKTRLLELPFHFAIDDAQFYTFGWLGSDSPAQRMSDPDRVLEMWWAAFLQQYSKGGYLNVCVHPYVSGARCESTCSIN